MSTHIRLDLIPENVVHKQDAVNKIVTKKSIWLKSQDGKFYVCHDGAWYIITNEYYNQLAKVLLGDTDGST